MHALDSVLNFKITWCLKFQHSATTKNLNNICNNFVNTDYEEVSAYNCVLSMDKNPISTALGQQTDHIQSHVENSTPKSAPSLLFEASGRFFGVVYHDVS